MPPQVNVKCFSRAKVDPEMPPAPIVTVSAPVIQKKRVTLPPVKEESESESESDSESDSSDDESDDEDNDADDELEQLTRTKYVSKVAQEKNMKAQKEQEKEAEKERKKMEKEEEKQQKKLEKAQRDVEKAAEKAQKNAEKEATKKVKTEDSALFSKKGSELYGRDKLELIAKFNQFKVLFPDNKKLQALKMKKNCTVDELQQYLAECDAIIETDCVESFVTDSILQCLKMMEMVSARTRYNIKGLADMLRANPQFNTLARQLYFKYKVFGSAPPEAQMLLLIATSTWVCSEKNKTGTVNQSILGRTINTNDL